VKGVKIGGQEQEQEGGGGGGKREKSGESGGVSQLALMISLQFSLTHLPPPSSNPHRATKLTLT